MPKQLNVNLQFTADTTQARQQLKQLQQDLSKITTSANPTASGMQFTDQLNKATDAATRLQAILKSATNVETGNLDLRKFNEGLKSSGMTLKDYRDQLVSLGPQGQAAFAALTTSIQNAEMPARRINGYLEQLKVSLANTARWQISSSILHGFMSSVSHAYNYAQELNKSLNDIRIVTGYNTDQMAEFAETANKAARALSTTTTEYTNASLIYYQQGLSDQEVQQRTDVTIKMANAAGVSAQTVSDQLTAVWNNFYDGSKSLEYYADVMVRLGADTASSTDEISDGLNKFAAVADTVGLSYEYAASALATITATTRQSADVVGTALRTLFARIQGLSLGETLDDGTNLNKYSKALASVGIDIKTQNGELKDMDQILSEMGNKWETLSKDQQVALAQTVAGVRQYNQLLSLMDNWDYFEENLERAYGATGSLDEQADIYAESWEAAQKRVSAVAEAIYADLFNDEAFIKITDALAGILEYVGNVIDALGGFGGVMSALGTIGMKAFGKDIAGSIINVGKSIKDVMTGESSKIAIDLKSTSSGLLAGLQADLATPTGDTLSRLQTAQGNLQLSLIQNAERLTEEDRTRAQVLLDQNQSLANMIQKTQTAIDLQKTQNQTLYDNLLKEKVIGGNGSLINLTQADLTGLNTAGAASSYLNSLKGIYQQIQNLSGESSKVSQSGLLYLLNNLQDLDLKSFLDKDVATNLSKDIDALINKIKDAKNVADDMFSMPDDDIRQLINLVNQLDDDINDIGSGYKQQIKNFVDETEGATEAQKKQVKNLIDSTFESGKAQADLGTAAEANAQQIDRMANSVNNLSIRMPDMATKIAAASEVVGSLSMAFFGLQGIFDVLQNDDLSFWEKLFSVLTSGTMIASSLASSFSTISKVYNEVKAARNALAQVEEVASANKQRNEILDAGATVLAAKAQDIKNQNVNAGSGSLVVYNDQLANKISLESLDSGTKMLPGNNAQIPLLGNGKNFTNTISNFLSKGLNGLSKIGTKIGKFLGTPAGAAVSAAIIAGVTDAAYSITRSYSVINKANEAHQQAIEDSGTVASAADEANSAYNTLLDTIDNYNSAIDNINNLTEGTKEFKDAIISANDAARELINTYGAVGEYNTESGTYEFSDEELKRIEQLQQQQAENAQLASITANQTNLRTENSANIANTVEEALGGNEFTRVALPIILGLAAGALTVLTGGAAGVALAVGAGVGAASGAVSAGYDNLTEADAVNALTALSNAYNLEDGDYDAAINSLTDAQINTIKALGMTDDELANLCAELKANSEAVKESNKEAVDTAFSDNEIYANSRYQSELNAALAANYGSNAEKLYEEKWKDKGFGGGGIEDKVAQEAYMNAQGYLKYENLDNNMGRYWYGEGEEDYVEISDEQARRWLAEKEALDALEGSVGEYNAALMETVHIGNQIADGLGNVLLDMVGGEGSDFAEATRSQIRALRTALDEGGEEIISKWEEMGYESPEAYEAALKTGMNSFDQAFINYQKELNAGGLQGIALGNFGDLTRQQAESITKTMISAFESGGRELTNLINNVLLQAGEDAGQLAEIIEGIDWTDPSAVSQLTAAVKEQGIEVDVTSAAFLAMANAMAAAGQQSLTLEGRINSLRSALAELRGIIDGIDFGSVISDEDFNKLMEYDSGVRDMFLMTPEGYQFVGNQEDLDRIEQIQADATIEGIHDTYNDSRLAGRKLTSSSQWNWDLASSDYYADTSNTNALAALANTYLAEGKSFYNVNGLDQAFGISYDALKNAQEVVAEGAPEEGADQTEIDQYNNALDLLNRFVTNSESFMSEYQEGIYSEEEEQRTTGEMQASMARSLEELNQMLASGEISQDTYDKARPIVEEYEEQQISEKLGVGAEAYRGVKDEVETSLGTERVEDLAEVGVTTDELTEELIKQEQATEKLASSWDDYSKILKTADKNSIKYQETLADTKTQLEDIVGIDLSEFDGEFFVENAELIKSALEGSEEAYDQLKAKIAGEQIQIQFNIDDSALYQIQPYINDFMSEDIEVGMGLDASGFYENLETALYQAGLGVDQISELLNSWGWAPEVQLTNVDVDTAKEMITRHGFIEIPDVESPTGKRRVDTTEYFEGWEGTDKIQVFSINRPATFKTANYNSPISSTGSSTGGGGGGSTSKTVEKPKKSDVVERYKELNDTIDDLTDAIDDASKASDRLYGRSRIQAIQQENDLLLQQIDVLKQKKAAAEANLATDRQALNIAAQQAGVSFTYDENGNISNYTSQMTALYNQLSATIDAANADGNATEEEQEQIDKLQELIDELTDAIGQYDETKELIQDLDNEITDAFYQWQDNNYEMLHYELEIEITLNDLALEKIDYYLNKLTDDFYAMAEAAQYMTDQIPQFTDALGHYEDFYNNISAAYAAGEISQADYVDGLKESYSSILDYLTQLNELDKEMMHYYEDTLSAASDELDKYTDKLDYATDVLDHYKNIIELVNGEQDYDRIDTVLRGQAKTVGNSLEAALEEQAMLQRERDAILQEIANAPDEAARELLQNELDAVDSRLMEVGEEVYSYGEQQAEIWAEILANSMEEAAHAMEQAFTDGMGFDFLNDSLDRLSSYADEYLTKTNQIYETQTLMNKAQEAADKTNNEAAKQRLNNFIQETQELQEKNQLSNLELEIQQAKYDLLLAEIALEEAQRAKSTVRLERDSEGNYGYVYTADQENVSAAEQDLLDAQNRLYNIGLEGTNEYGQKLIELTQELEENLKALNEAYMIDKTIDEEQYNAQRQQLLEEYYQLAEAYSNNYTTAMEVDTAIQEEAWVNAYDNIIGKTDEWESVTEEYLDACNNAYNEWQNEVVNENEIVQEAMNDTKASVDAVTEASDDLKNKVVNEVVPAIEKELGSVRAITNAYAQQRSAIQELISYYEKLVDQIYAAIAAETARANAQAQQKDDFDFSKDYSDLMDKAAQEEDWDAYYQYKADRDYKIQHGYDYAGVTTDTLDKYFQSGGQLNGQYVNQIDYDKWFKEHGVTMATGGYTGEWGGSGRLALLHEKELVLNEDDTANFLVATGILRSLSSLIDLNALSNSLGSFTNQLTMAVSGSHDTIEQQVHIEASFPSVTDHNEIELALSNLVNTASQFANRKSL